MLIEMKDIVKTYGSVTANDHVSIHLNKGEILSIVGENGAGKSTIMKILYGLERCDSGEIFINGQKARFAGPSDAINHGIGMVQQHFMQFDSMTVTENIIYNREIRNGIFLNRGKASESIRKLSEENGLPIDPDARISDLSIGLQQRVEILKILHQQSDIIIFDEPTAVLTPLESEELLKTILQLKASGKSVILITHKLQEVMDVSDRIVVMRSGRVVYESLAKDTDIEALTVHMVGYEIPKQDVKPEKAGKACLEVKDLSVYDFSAKPVVDRVSFALHEGEILGIAGVSGNGQSELIRAITGLLKSDAGQIILNGTDVTNQSVHFIRKHGLSHVPEDRYYWGSAREATLEENALMGFEDDDRFNRNGVLQEKAIRSFARDLIQTYAVKSDSSGQKMRELSGGNAQKLIVARELASDAGVLVISEPTRGIDIGASEFIHNRILEKRDNGHGILLMSSDLSEIMTLCDRILVMFEGRINRVFTRGEADARTLGIYMVKEGGTV